MKLTKCPHLSVDAISPVLNKGDVKRMLRELADLVEMKIIAPEQIIWGADYNPGVTGTCIIEFSNITIHSFTKDKQECFFLDLFSCKDFSVKAVKKFLREKGITNITAHRHWRIMKL